MHSCSVQATELNLFFNEVLFHYQPFTEEQEVASSRETNLELKN